MDILVCMKQVIDDSVPLDPAGLESASTILNPYDGYALELALRYVQKHEGSVTVLSAELGLSLFSIREWHAGQIRLSA